MTYKVSFKEDNFTKVITKKLSSLPAKVNQELLLEDKKVKMKS